MLKLQYTSRLCRRVPVPSTCRLLSSGDGEDSITDNQQKLNSKDVGKQEQELSPTEKREQAKTKLASLISSLSVSTPGKSVQRKPIKLFTPTPTRGPYRDEDMELRDEFRKVDFKMASAVKSVSEEIGGGVETQSELLKSLQNWQNSTDDSSASDIKDVLSGFSVRASKAPPKRWRIPRSEPQFLSKEVVRTNLFEGPGLGIFTPQQRKQPELGDELSTWDACEKKTLEYSVARPPGNHFEELIQWTEEGKIWQFPIDNEIGLEEETNVGFHEHIFLEGHLASWCPRKGPIRSFMELVCIGLSKNPFISVQRKKDVIKWYKDYFEARKETLVDLKAYPEETRQST